MEKCCNFCLNMMHLLSLCKENWYTNKNYTKLLEFLPLHFDCCKQSLNQLYQPPTHPSIHPHPPILPPIHPPIQHHIFMGLIPNFYFVNFKKAILVRLVSTQNLNAIVRSIQLQTLQPKCSKIFIDSFTIFEITKFWYFFIELTLLKIEF